MILKPCAKINVCLKVTGVREDGYHLLRMVNLPIDLHDVIEIEKINAVDTYIATDGLGWGAVQESICHKALDLLRKTYGFQENFNIKIHKEIPFAAGLGGGSSDAAFVMLAVKKILKLQISDEELNSLALKIGADVPYFLNPKPALLEGIGEKITYLDVKNKYYCLIVKPARGCSTQEIYQKCNDFQGTRIDVENVLKALKEGDDDLLQKSMGNDLQLPAESLLPEIGEIYSQFVKMGFRICGMTGSGSAMFALSTKEKEIKEAAKVFLNQGYLIKVCNVMR